MTNELPSCDRANCVPQSFTPSKVTSSAVPVFRSQNSTLRVTVSPAFFRVTVTSVSPSGKKATGSPAAKNQCLERRNVDKFCPDSASQILTDTSELPVAILCPSGEKAMDDTMSACPV